jgi:hypothetical protein
MLENEKRQRKKENARRKNRSDYKLRKMPKLLLMLRKLDLKMRDSIN